MKAKINKILSIVLSVAILVTVCICAFTTVAASKEITYYISASGSDTASGLTVSEPLLTVDKAIENAKDATFTTGDTVYLNLVDYTAINWTASSDYDFQLIIRSNDSAVRNTLVIPNGFVFGGSVLFENVIVQSISNVYYGDQNISFDKDCTFVATNHFLGRSSGASNETVTSAESVYFGNAIASKNFRLSNKTASNKIYKEDVSVAFANSVSTPTIYLTAESGATTFQKNLNINIINAKSAAFLASGGTVSVGGALQVVINANTSISEESKQVLSSVSAAGGLYYIINASNVDNMINVTETAGKYAVNTDRYTVTATDTDGNKIVAKDGYLTLSAAGEYTVTVVKNIETPVYYVGAAGNSDNDGLTADTPLLTVDDVVAKANAAGYWGGDTVNVKVIGTDAVSWGSTKGEGYDFILSVESYDTSSLSTLSVTNGTFFGGDTAFDNINVSLSASSSNVYTNNHSIKIGENVTFKPTNLTLGTSSTTGTYGGKTAILENDLGSVNIAVANNSHHNGVTYTDDVNLVLNNQGIKATLTVAVYHGGIATFNKNLNINVMNADTVTVGGITNTNSSKFKVKGSLQFIINESVNLNETSFDRIKGIDADGGVYYIKNSSGISDLLSFTETAGKYVVNQKIGDNVVVAVDAAGQTTVAKDGYLTLANPGDYVVTTQLISKTATYYVKSSGSDDNNGTSSTTPLASVAKAVELANAAGYIKGDTVTIRVIRTSTWYDSGVNMGDVPKYNFDLVVTADSSSQSKINIDAGHTIANNAGGTTTYKNININQPASWSSLACYDSKVIFDSSSKVTGSYVTLVYGTNNDGGAGKTIPGQTVEYNGTMPPYISLANSSWSGRTYSGDVNLVLNNSSSTTDVQFNSYYSSNPSGSTTYNKNLNINIKAIKSLSFSNMGGANINGALQIIDSQGLSITADTAGIADLSCDKWIINNSTGNNEILSFTNVAGKFAVDTNSYKLTATDSKGNSYVSANGYLVLGDADVYTVDLTHQHAYTDDCDTSCDSCGEIRTDAHIFINECDDTCDTCGTVRTDNHSFDNSCDAICNLCFATRNISHTYKNNCAKSCDICNTMRTPFDHIFENDCDTECAECGLTRVTEHVFDNNCDADCNECGETRIPSDHIYNDQCDTECNLCGAIREVEHIYTNACDKECDNCGFTRKTTHVYDYDCDPECNICGWQRNATHVYDNKCDADCNICKGVRTPDSHVFDDEFDLDCSECGFIRENEHIIYEGYVADQTKHWRQCSHCDLQIALGEHTFDNECDRKCNVCGYIRLVEAHKYDKICDSDCNECGHLRAVKHTYSLECDNSCDVCGYIRENVSHTGGEATCKKKAICDICGVEYGETNDNHSGRIVYRNKVTVTCGKDGYGGDPVCLDCNKSAGTGEIIPATGLHKYDNACDSQCSTCGNTRTTNHYYAPATCETPEICYICGVTGEAALGHSYVSKAQKATLTSDGLSYEECSECKTVINETVISKIQSITLLETIFEYDGQEKTPNVLVEDANGNTVSSNYYTVTYADSCKDVGEYNVIVKFNTNYSAQYTLSFAIVPAKTSIGNVTAGTFTLGVTVEKCEEQVTGYQVQYSTSEDFSSAKVKSITDSSVTSADINNLNSNTVYYVRVRTYIVVNGQRFYSEWSDYKQIETQ